MIACLLAAAALPGSVQEPLELRAGEALTVALVGGRAALFAYTADFRGAAYVSAASTAEGLVLSVADELDGREIEDGAGERRSPCAVMSVVPGRKLRIRLTSSADASATVGLLAAPESDDARAAVEEARAAMDRATGWLDEGRVEDARNAIARAFEELTSVPTADSSPAVEEFCWALAEAAARVGDLRSRAGIRRWILERNGRFFPLDHPRFVVAQANLAAALKDLGGLDEALELEEQVERLRTRILDPGHPELLKARRNLAATLLHLGRHERAIALNRGVIADLEASSSPDDLGLHLARLNLAGSLFNLGRHDEAEAEYAKVLEDLSRLLPADHDYVQFARINLATSSKASGRWKRARELEEDALRILTAKHPLDHPQIQTARLNLALTLRKTGELAAARSLQEEVLAVRIRALNPDSIDVQDARTGLAQTLLLVGDLQAARELLEPAVAALARTLPDDHRALVDARRQLGQALMLQGDLEGALRMREKVLAVVERALPPDHLEVQAARYDLAMVLERLGDLERARDLKAEVVRVFEAAVDEDDPNLLAARTSLAYTLSLLGDFAAAAETHAPVLDSLAAFSPDHPAVRTARHNAAQIAIGRGEPAEPILVEQARSLTRSVRSWFATLSPREAEERTAALDGQVALILSAALGIRGEPLAGLRMECLELTEAARASALRSARWARLAADDVELARLRGELVAAGEEVARRARIETDAAELSAARAANDEAWRSFRAALTERGVAVELEPARLLARCPAGTALVGYRRHNRLRFVEASGTIDEGSVAMTALVVHGGGIRLVELGSAGAVEQAVEEWRTAIAAPTERGVGAIAGERDHAVLAGARLRALAIDPVLNAVGEVDRLVIAADDVLHAVPFDALPAGDSGAELVGDHVRIEVRTALSELLDDPPALRAGNLVVMGNVDYDRGPDESPAGGAVAALLRGGSWERGFRPLMATEGEARAIAHYFERESASLTGRPEAAEAVLLEGEGASRDALLAAARGARFLHLATHGWFAPESVYSSAARTLDAGMSREEQVRGSSPMVLSGLALSGANLPADALGRVPGLITAEEIAGLDLTNCELAVLSACDTNVGVRRAGQGVASLQKALHMAGARTVVTSLWKVPDEATRELMVGFYRRMWVEGKPKATALWEAKMRIRDARDALGGPRYSIRDWAGWILSGSPD